jgi:hypothetical protein
MQGYWLLKQVVHTFTSALYGVKYKFIRRKQCVTPHAVDNGLSFAAIQNQDYSIS